MSDLIDRQAALDALGERPTVWTDDDDYALGERNQYDMDRLAIETVPPAQLAQDLTNGCTDTISRVAAIDALNKMKIYRPLDSDRYVISDCLNKIINLPSAQPGWIPCSERCPEQSGWYLVSLKNGNVQKAWYRVAPINQGGSYWRSPIKRPLAWMPLPTPYREGGQDGKN